MNKTFEEKLHANPDSFDDADCRPQPGAYPEANREAVTPPHVKKLLEERTANKKRVTNRDK